MRLDQGGNLTILETNSLPSLGEHGSYLVGAGEAGLDFAGVVNRLVEVASARYFGTPRPPKLEEVGSDPAAQVFSYITQRRDEMERRLREWTNLHSHTVDPVGVQEAVRRADRLFRRDLGMRVHEELTDERATWTWETKRGLDDGTLFVLHLDVPTVAEIPTQRFRREPEWLYGDGIGSSRAPLTMLEYVLRAVRSIRRLHRKPVGVLCYTDEGRDARYSEKTIRRATALAGRVLVLRPGNQGDFVVTKRRGQRKYRFRAEESPRRLGRVVKRPELVRWAWNRLEDFCAGASGLERVSVSVLDLKTDMLPMHLPHRVTSTVVVTYPDEKTVATLESDMRARIPKGGPRWELERISDRPSMPDRASTVELARSLKQIGERLEIPLKAESSAWASVAGLVPEQTACLCGLGPVARDLGTPQESVLRISLVQRALLLAQYLVQHA
jgi:D-alanine-D-alanine ligase